MKTALVRRSSAAAVVTARIVPATKGSEVEMTALRTRIVPAMRGSAEADPPTTTSWVEGVVVTMAMAKEMTVPTMIPRALDVPTMMAQVVEKPGEPTTMTKILDVLKTTAMALDAPMMTAEGLDALTTMVPMGEDIQAKTELNAPTTKGWATGKLSVLTRKS